MAEPAADLNDTIRRALDSDAWRFVREADGTVTADNGTCELQPGQSIVPKDESRKLIEPAD